MPLIFHFFICQVQYENAKVDKGNVLTPTLVKDIPKVNWEVSGNSYYTLCMTGEYQHQPGPKILCSFYLDVAYLNNKI